MPLYEVFEEPVGEVDWIDDNSLGSPELPKDEF